MNKILRNSIIAAMVLGIVGTSSFYNYTYAKDPKSVEEGEGAKADGIQSVAIGYGAKTNANAHYSVACGLFAEAKSQDSTAIGNGSQGQGKYSIALGAYSIATDENEVSVGRDVGQHHIDGNRVESTIYRRITHVADGTGDHDAVTLSQARAFVNGEIDVGNTTSSVTGAKIKAELDKKVDKSALAGYAKTTDLANKANTSDLDAYAKTSDLNAYAKSTELTTKANTNADNITVSDWATKLGTGEVATGNANLVTGGKVFDALSAYAKSTELTTKANTNADNITVSDWATALGIGEVATGNTNLVTGGKVFDAIKDKADKSALSAYAKTSALSELETKVTNITNGTTKIDVTNIDLATNNTFKTLQSTVNGKANANADNITVSDWATKLGTGTVATGDANLVTGGTVFNAIKDKADKSALSDYAKASDLTTLKTQVTNITSGATEVDGSKINLATNTTFTGLQTTVNGKANVNADNITVGDWATKLGTGDVATGNTNLVTGGKVFDALSAYAKTTALTELETKVTNITNGTTKIDAVSYTHLTLPTN